MTEKPVFPPCGKEIYKKEKTKQNKQTNKKTQVLSSYLCLYQLASIFMIILFEREGYRHECDFINEQKMPSGNSFLSERIIPKFGSPVKSKHKIYQKEIKKKGRRER